MPSGKLFVISGPSGAGKGTICKSILMDDENVKFSVSMTTRPPRTGEIDGVDYYFVTTEKFESLLEEGGLLEYNRYVSNYYGTPREHVISWLNEGYDVILEIDFHGAFQVRKSYPEAVLIFILPPSIDDLRKRIMERGSEDEDSLNKRLQEALKDIEQADNYDYRVVNSQLETAILEVKDILDKERRNQK